MQECTKCAEIVSKWEIFPKGLCLKCHEVEFDKLSDAEKVPNFNNILAI